MGCCHHTEWGLPATTDAAAGCAQCAFEAFVRNHFYTGKMMGAAEFITETHYHAERMRHHNVRLHGWGVVCGLKVHQHRSPDCRKRFVVVEPGSALDCCGHEILVPAPEIVEVAAFPQVQELRRDNFVHTLQLCVRWRECPTEQVPVLYDECGCDDTRCAPNRILESYDFDVLVDPVLSLAQLVGRKAEAAFVASKVHGVTGSVPAADGEVLVIDPEQPTRLLRIDPARRAMQALMLPAAAAALALASDGARVFVVLRGSAAAPEAEVRVFQRSDLSEVPTIAAARKLPGTTANSRLRAVAGKVGGNAVLSVLNVDNGELHRFAHDAAHVIADAPAAPVALPANLGAITSDGDTRAFAIDGAKIIAIDLAAGTRSDLVTLSGTAPLELSALAAFGNGAQPAVAVVGSAAGQPMLWALEVATPATVHTQPLAHRPLFVAAAGGWLQVYEDHNSHGMVQAVELPLAAQPRVSAPRFTGGGQNEVVLLFDGGEAGALAVSQLADSDCADLLWKQLEGCPDCGRPDCVVLATLAHYRPDAEMLDEKAAPPAVRIDNRLGRRLLASTATLQAWLECLQLKGGVPGPAGPPGDNGDPGPGIDDVQATFVPCEQPGSATLQVAGGVTTLVLEIPRGCDGENGQGSPGQGIDAVTATFVPCNVPGAATIVTVAGARTLVLTIPRGCDGKDGEGLERDLTQIVEIGWKHDDQGNKLWPVKLLGGNPFDVFGLWLRFSKPVHALDHGSVTYTPHALTVQLPSQALPPRVKLEERNAGLRETPDAICWCEAVGIIVPARFDGNVIEEVPGPESEVWAFVFSQASVKRAQENRQLMVRLRGDFFVDEAERAVDAEFPRAKLPSGDRPAGSPLGIQGGVFESWFWLGEGLGKLAINKARREEIVALPGIGPSRARKVIALRTERPFESFADFRARLELSEADAALLEPLVSFPSVER